MCDRWAIVEGWYWYLTDHHGGQGSEDYARLCRVSEYFTPGVNDHGPRTPEAREVYNNAREENGHRSGYVECHVCWSVMIGHPGDICETCLEHGAEDAYGLSVEAAAEYRPEEDESEEDKD